MQYINDMMAKFAAKHGEHLELYGEDNAKRLTGQHETSSMEQFSFGVGNRAASFRIPSSTAAANGKGYVEDRRPASNIDPYLVSSMLVDTGVLAQSQAGDLKAAFASWKAWRAENPIPN
jgi:glutamine synthetase